MTTSALRRQVKNIVHNYSEAEVKVREATSNDPWGPSSSLMSEIAELTFSVAAFSEVMAMVWKRLNDHGKNWRHVYKALTLLDYLAKTGSERVAQQCRENAFTIQTLRDFQFVDRDGRDQGVNVREKAKQLVALLRDEDRLRHERALALKTKERLASAGGGGGSGTAPASYPSRRSSQPSMAALYGEEFSRSRGSPSSFTSSPSSPRASDLEHSRPQTSGEEELQLQLALAMSRESAMIHLVDIFGPSGPSGPSGPIEQSDAPTSDDLWDAQPSCPVTSDPWESVSVVNTSTPVVGSPWKSHPSSSSPDHQWVKTQSPLDPWGGLPTKTTSKASEKPWRSPVRPASAGVDPFTIHEEEEPGVRRPNSVFSPRCESPADIDPFSDLVVGGQVNGRVEASSVTFDQSHLGPPLDSVTPRKCCTPEAFLGPTAASLINLDTLIPSKQQSQTHTPNPANVPTKSKNPFLSGLSTPSPTNPFHCDQRRLTLNQMRPNSTSPLPAHALPGALPYSASLPLPSSQNAPQPPDLPPNLPQPLLPLSSMPRLQTAPQLQSHSNNPFL
ncbi:epsin-3 isoform X2 [Silurus meridionalis]|uniref:epsin-3 isoform X2 n=1 Tax=Silurus meridionalis TaxID=175797 RepID=UPI001EEBED91|nr:epsin-3 isoform X2 [Silurus meridionalis]